MMAAWFHTHLAVLPVLLPSFTAMALLLLGDAPARRGVARGLAVLSCVVSLVLAVLLTLEAAQGALRVYRVGEWAAPFGIVLVVDRLSALMLVLTSTVALAAVLYACTGWDARGRHFHALFQFQLMGLNGAFVTGDLFNLFVFFEVLLIASYVLLLHGQGTARLRAGVHFVVLNLAASVLFLIGVALLYATTGTLNYADLALRVPQVTEPTLVAVMQAGALILLVVFGFKAALMPMAMWLPAAYASASAPVAALFAIMTKVGVYAMWRVHGVIFGPDAGASADLIGPVMLPLALLTSVAGALGALSAKTFSRLVAWLTVASVGTLLAAFGLSTESAWSAALYYMVHSTLVMAALFLLSEMMGRQRGDVGVALDAGPRLSQPVWLGVLLLVGAVSTAGLPPWPGFIGKLMILDAASDHAAQTAVWAVVLVVGFFSMLSLAKAGSILFWKTDVPRDGVSTSGAPPQNAAGLELVAVAFLSVLGIAMSVCAAPLSRYTEATAAQLRDLAPYTRAVLGEEVAAGASTTRPYRPTTPVKPASGTPAAPTLEVTK